MSRDYRGMGSLKDGKKIVVYDTKT